MELSTSEVKHYFAFKKLKIIIALILCHKAVLLWYQKSPVVFCLNSVSNYINMLQFLTEKTDHNPDLLPLTVLTNHHRILTLSLSLKILQKFQSIFT